MTASGCQHLTLCHFVCTEASDNLLWQVSSDPLCRPHDYATNLAAFFGHPRRRVCRARRCPMLAWSNPEPGLPGRGDGKDVRQGDTTLYHLRQPTHQPQPAPPAPRRGTDALRSSQAVILGLPQASGTSPAR